jgi:DNA-directed RNA polymerase specialized sigma24 family protein
MDGDRTQGAEGERFSQLDPELEARLADVSKKVLRAARRRVSGDEADDIAQEITDSIRKRLALTRHFLRGEKKRAAYVRTAVRNKCNDRSRAEKAAAIARLP